MMVKPRVNRTAVDLGAWRTAAFISSTPAIMPGPSPLSCETTMVDMPWLARTSAVVRVQRQRARIGVARALADGDQAGHVRAAPAYIEPCCDM